MNRWRQPKLGIDLIAPEYMDRPGHADVDGLRIWKWREHLEPGCPAGSLRRHAYLRLTRAPQGRATVPSDR